MQLLQHLFDVLRKHRDVVGVGTDAGQMVLHLPGIQRGQQALHGTFPAAEPVAAHKAGRRKAPGCAGLFRLQVEHPGGAPHRHQAFTGPEGVQSTALQHRKVHDAAHAAPVLAGIHAQTQLDGGVGHDGIRHQGGPLVAEDKAGAAGTDLGKHLVEG